MKKIGIGLLNRRAVLTALFCAVFAVSALLTAPQRAKGCGEVSGLSGVEVSCLYVGGCPLGSVCEEAYCGPGGDCIDGPHGDVDFCIKDTYACNCDYSGCWCGCS